MPEKKIRSKHIGYNAQREQCRINKYTYIEKINGVPYLFCNYPFPQPEHKKGICKAGTCTDMREIPHDVVAADEDVNNTLESIPLEKGTFQSMTKEEYNAKNPATGMPCESNE